MLEIATASVNPRAAIPFTWFEQRLGYAVGRNLRFELRLAAQPADYRLAWAEVPYPGADILLARGSETVLRGALAVARGTLPVVIAAIDYDYVALGAVADLSRLGGNVTGLLIRQPELARKRLALVAESLPGPGRVLAFWDSASADQ